MPKIKVEEVQIEAARFREDYGDVEELAVSIQKYGLFHPIVVDREKNLIAGERRLRAHKMLGVEIIEVKYVDEVDMLTKREMELEENLRRKSFTWQEEITAKAEVDKIKREKYGSAIRGHGGGWGLKDTARMLNESTGLTSRDIKLAEAIKEHPELAKEKNKEAAWRRAQKIKERAIIEVLSNTVEIKIDTNCLVHGDSTEEMKKLESESVDLVLTDPPFGIELTMKGESSWDNKTYNDDFQHVLNTIDLVIKECFRVLKNDRCMYVFFDIRHLEAIRNLVRHHGFHCADVPCIWYKTGGGGQGGNDVAYVSNYEAFFFCHKGRRALNKIGDSNVLAYPRMAPQYKIHPTEKPTNMLRHLIEQSTFPGELVIDPFAGGNTTMMASYECKRNAWGCELDKEYYNQGILKLETFHDKKDEDVVEEL